MFSPFRKTSNPEPPRDALDTAVRDAISEIDVIEKAAATLLDAIPLAREIASLPMPEAARDVAAREIAGWSTALRRTTFAAALEESTRAFRILRDGMVAAAKRLAN